MKKSFLLLLVICLMAGMANAQQNYIRLGLGGGVGLKQYDGYDWANENETNNSDDYEFKSMSMGGGFNVNLAFGHMLSDNVGLELGVNEFIGLSRKINVTSTSSSYDYKGETKLSSMMLQIVPAVVITPGIEGVNPYARLGMIIGILPSITEKFEGTYTSSGEFKETSQMAYKSKISGGLPLGFTAAAGATFNLGEKLNFFAELVFNGITYAPKKGKLKEWTIDGKDELATATTKEKEWTYEKKINDDEEIPDGCPDKEAKTSVNFSNVELNIGVRLKL
jgi:hypothetical protein